VRVPAELNLNEDPDARETAGSPRVDDVGGNADETDDRLADGFGSLESDGEQAADAPTGLPPEARSEDENEDRPGDLFAG